MPRTIFNWPRIAILALIRLYQMTISRGLPENTCRFYPTCSCYAQDALRRHGALKGSWLAVRRIGRCHPWNPGGYDPVPDEVPPFLKRPSHG